MTNGRGSRLLRRASLLFLSAVLLIPWIPSPALRAESPTGDAPVQSTEEIDKLATLMSDRNPENRVEAIRALGRVGTKEALLQLRKGLSDASPLVRYYAVLGLGEAGDPSMIEAVGGNFDDPDPDVREAANDAFTRMPDAGDGLLLRYLREGNRLQKIGAAAAVRKARYRPALALLMQTMHDPVPEVKVSAVAALIALAEPSTVECLAEGLKDPEIRWLCVVALRQFGDANLLPLLRGGNDAETEHWKRIVLEGMGDRVLAGCLDMLRKNEDVGVRIATLCTLKQVKDMRAILPMIGLLGDEKVGYVAGFILSQMGEAAVEPLVYALEDESPSVRARAAAALGDLGCAGGARPLRALLADPDLQVRKAAEEAIRKLGG